MQNSANLLDAIPKGSSIPRTPTTTSESHLSPKLAKIPDFSSKSDDVINHAPEQLLDDQSAHPKIDNFRPVTLALPLIFHPLDANSVPSPNSEPPSENSSFHSIIFNSTGTSSAKYQKSIISPLEAIGNCHSSNLSLSLQPEVSQPPVVETVQKELRNSPSQNSEIAETVQKTCTGQNCRISVCSSYVNF